MPPTLQLCLFGAPRLVLGTEVLHVGARKALALLALLAVEGTAPRAALAARLWPDADADAALRNLRQELFRLRRIGVVPAATAERCLALPPGLEVDTALLDAAAARGDDAAALALTAAKALDGLDGLAGADFDAWLERVRARLLQQRARLRQRLAQRLAREGRPAEALTLHQQALAEDACAEGDALAAMQLLVAMGERAAARALWSRLQRSLRLELDLAPAAATRAAVAELGLAGDTADGGPTADRADTASVAPPLPALPSALLPERIPFVGREHERAAIEAACAAGRRIYLGGVAGTGKTRLAAACAAARGAWLRVGCAPGDRGVPYSSALRVLRALHEAASDVELPPWVRRELACLMPELGDGPPPLPGAEAGERLRAAFAAAWRQLSGDNFATIVLDDWHAADDASVELWRRIETGGAAAIVVHRSAQLPPAALAALRDEVDRGLALRLEIGDLDAAEALALVQAASGSPQGRLFARRLHQATGGNAFFIVETLRHLSLQGQLLVGADGRWSTPYDEATEDYAELPVPPSVREVVLGRVRALGDGARRLLEAASLLGDPFDAQLLHGCTEADPATTVALLEHAQAARLVATEGERYRFAHDLVANCLVQSLSPARRALLHARLARRLQDAGADPSQLARHLEGAGEQRSAAHWRCMAAAAAWRVHALAEAAQHARQALADGAEAADAAAVSMLLAEVERYRGNGAAFLQALQAAVDAAQALDPAQRLEARLTQLRHWVTADRVAQVLQALDLLQADLAVAAAPLRARAAAVHALALQMADRLDEAQALEDEAIALLDNEPQALAQRTELLDAAARTAARANRFDRAEALARRAVAAAELLGDPAAQSRALVVLGITLLHARNDRAAAAEAFERARRLAMRCGHVPQQRAAILNLVKLHADAGRGDEAAALLDEGLALAPGFEHPRAEQAFAEARYFVHYLRGDLAAAQDAAGRLLEMVRRIDDRQIRLAATQLVLDLYLHTGQLDTAERLLAGTAEDAGSGLHAVLVAKRAWLERARGRPRQALALLDGAAARTRVEDELVAAWVGAAAALDLGDADDAARRLAAVDIADEHTVDALAMLLVQRLRLAQRLGIDDPAARQRAVQLLPRAPALEAALLRQALR